MAAHPLSSIPPSTRIPKPGSRIPNPFHLSLTQNFKIPGSQNPRLGIPDLFHQSSNPVLYFGKRRHITASVLSSLPTANPERVNSTEKDSNVKWSAKAIKAYAIAETEAGRLKYETTGTEALLIGIVYETTNLAAKFLQENGFTLTRLREETIKVRPKGDIFFSPPPRPPLTESAQKALDWAVDEKLKSGKDGEVTTSHLLLGIWSLKESKGHKILATLGFTDEKANELQSVISKPGFSDV